MIIVCELFRFGWLTDFCVVYMPCVTFVWYDLFLCCDLLASCLIVVFVLFFWVVVWVCGLWCFFAMALYVGYMLVLFAVWFPTLTLAAV